MAKEQADKTSKTMVLTKPLCFRKMNIHGQYFLEFTMQAGQYVTQPDMQEYAEKNYPTFIEWV